MRVVRGDGRPLQYQTDKIWDKFYNTTDAKPSNSKWRRTNISWARIAQGHYNACAKLRMQECPAKCQPICLFANHRRRNNWGTGARAASKFGPGGTPCSVRPGYDDNFDNVRCFHRSHTFNILFGYLHTSDNLVVLTTSLWYYGNKSAVDYNNGSFLPARRYVSAGLCDSDVSVCLSVRLSVCLSHAGIVPSRAKARSWNVHHLIAPWL